VTSGACALVACLLYGVHPLRVEVVAWCSCQVLVRSALPAYPAPSPLSFCLGPADVCITSPESTEPSSHMCGGSESIDRLKTKPASPWLTLLSRCRWRG